MSCAVHHNARVTMHTLTIHFQMLENRTVVNVVNREYQPRMTVTDIGERALCTERGQ
jgi:hypothetical protein